MKRSSLGFWRGPGAHFGVLERACSILKGLSQLVGSVHKLQVPIYQHPLSEQLLYVILTTDIRYFIEFL